MTDELISKADKNRIARLDNIDPAPLMMYLANQYHTELQAASPEMILAICWEESFFQNVRQLGGPAVGYGQLEHDGRRIASQHFTKNPNAGPDTFFSERRILDNRDVSIMAIGNCLGGLMERLRSPHAALMAYAGAPNKVENGDIPPRWQACEQELRSGVLTTSGTFDPIAFENALRKARAFETSGPVYDHIHRKLWPLSDLLSQVVDELQTGSQGAEVSALQDVLNGVPIAPMGDDFAPQPLAVDGRFGSRTQARVMAFQNQQGLDADGIVGPLTRAALRSVTQSLS